eukprot:scaffold5653_cov147-Cylindrotheca_fusiformis.AAC.21
MYKAQHPPPQQRPRRRRQRQNESSMSSNFNYPPGLLCTSDEEESSSLNSSILSEEPALFRATAQQQQSTDSSAVHQCLPWRSYDQPLSPPHQPRMTHGPTIQRARDDEFLRPITNRNKTNAIPGGVEVGKQKKNPSPQHTKRQSLILRALGKKTKEKKKEERPSVLNRVICKPRSSSESGSNNKTRSLSQPPPPSRRRRSRPPSVIDLAHREMEEFIEVSATPRQLARVKDLNDISPQTETPRPKTETEIQQWRTASLVDTDASLVENDATLVENEAASVFAEDNASQVTSDNIWAMAQCTQLCKPMPLDRKHQSAPPHTTSNKQRMAEKISRRVRSQEQYRRPPRLVAEEEQQKIPTTAAEPPIRTIRATTPAPPKQIVFSPSSSSDDDSILDRSRERVLARSNGTGIRPQPPQQQRQGRPVRPRRGGITTSSSSSSSKNRSQPAGRPNRLPRSTNRTQEIHAYLSKLEESKETKEVAPKRIEKNEKTTPPVQKPQGDAIVIDKKVAAEIQFHQRRKPKSRGEMLVSGSLERPGWMGKEVAERPPPPSFPSISKENYLKVNPNDIAGVLEDIGRPGSVPINDSIYRPKSLKKEKEATNVLNHSYIRKKIRASKQEDKSWLEDNSALGSQAFEAPLFDEGDSIFSDLKTETEYLNISLDTKKSVVSAITEYTDPSVEFAGCFA